MTRQHEMNRDLTQHDHDERSQMRDHANAAPQSEDTDARKE
jgi:hypothetical protein